MSRLRINCFSISADGFGAGPAQSLEQLDDAVAALSLVLAPADIAELEAPYVPHPVIGHE